MKPVFPLAILASGSIAAPFHENDLMVYPGADSALACPIYEVRVTQGDRTQEAFVYQSVSDWAEQSYSRHKQFFESLSYAGFAFAGEVTVEVTKVGRVRPGIPAMAWRPDLVNPPPPTGVMVRPERFAIEAELDGWIARFTIRQPGQYSVEFVDRDLDPSGTPLHGLMIFADPLEDLDSVPSKSAPEVFSLTPDKPAAAVPESATVVRLEPGVHELGPWVVPSRIRQVYLAPGAFVKGCLSIRDRADGFVLNGRGVLSAHHLGWHAKAAPGKEAGWYELPAPGKDYLKLLIVEGDHLTVDGIVLADSPFHTVGGSGTHHTWSWVKAMGWRLNNDGIPGFADSVIRHCFIRANDDAVWLYHDNLLVHDLVMWQGDNGACFQLGWSSKSARNVTVRDIDVIHGEWRTDRRRNNSGLVNLRISTPGTDGPGVQEDFLFENINVETPVATGIDIRMRKEAGEGGGRHTIRNFTFRNIRLQLEAGFPFARSFMVPWDGEFGFENVRFENLRVNGVLVTDGNHANEGRFDISSVATSDIGFDADTRMLVWFNPLQGLPSGLIDAAIICTDGQFTMVGINAAGIPARWTSSDLVSWSAGGPLSLAHPDWGRGPFSAPRLLYDPVRRKVFLVFQRGTGVGLASTDNLDGSWDLLTPDRPLAEGGHPSLFEDDGGSLYLVVDGARMTPIDPGNPGLIKDWVVLTGSDSSQATIVKKNGSYHLFWTEGDGESPMSGRYAVARSVIGPYQKSILTEGHAFTSGYPWPGPDGRWWFLSDSGTGLSLRPLRFDETAGLFLISGPGDAECKVELPTYLPP
ncbi:MAG: hypothetical protein R3F07_15030 [Opitutaceae bacterium]